MPQPDEAMSVLEEKASCLDVSCTLVFRSLIFFNVLYRTSKLMIQFLNGKNRLCEANIVKMDKKLDLL